jgi:hypothetical protein
MVAPASFFPADVWDEADRLGLVSMKSLVPQILARYELKEKEEERETRPEAAQLVAAAPEYS